MTSEFRIVGRVWSGRGSLARLPEAAKLLCLNRLFIVVDKGLQGRSPHFKLDAALKDLGIETNISFDAEPEPTTDCVDRVTSDALEFGADGVLGFGGGSAMDIAKAVSVLLKNPGPAAEYQGLEKLRSPGVPKIMVPTTAGTGSETTQSAVLINRLTKRKGGINGRWVMPDVAILDAELLDGIPGQVAASSCMDAVAHAIESLTARNATWLSARFSRAALELLLPAVRPALIQRDSEALQNLLYGAFCAGVGIANSETGGSHALAYPLGVHWGVPHGVANAILLPHVIRHNMPYARPAYLDMTQLLFGDTVVESIPERLCDLTRELSLKNHLSEWGIGKGDLEFLSQEGVKLQGPIANNPAPLTVEDAKQIYTFAF